MSSEILAPPKWRCGHPTGHPKLLQLETPLSDNVSKSKLTCPGCWRVKRKAKSEKVSKTHLMFSILPEPSHMFFLISMLVIQKWLRKILQQANVQKLYHTLWKTYEAYKKFCTICRLASKRHNAMHNVTVSQLSTAVSECKVKQVNDKCSDLANSLHDVYNFSTVIVNKTLM